MRRSFVMRTPDVTRDHCHVTRYACPVIETFADKRTQEPYLTGKAKHFPPDVARRAARKLEYVDLATRLDDLNVPPGNRLHALGRERKGQHAISVNDQWRISSASRTATPTTSRSPTTIEGEVCTMSIDNTGGMRRRPTHPGEMLREDFLPDYGLTVSGLADALGVSRQTVNELLRERRALSPEMALRLSRLFGNSPEFWLNAQRAVGLWDAAQAIKADVERIKPLNAA
jgi:addiction module HigA family antidote